MPQTKQRTLSIVKPDATRRNMTGSVIAMLEAGGLRIVAQKRLLLNVAQARTFYAVHKDRPFYESLVTFMTSAPVVVLVLEGEDAVANNRKIMGATNPKEAAQGTIRASLGVSLEANSVHGSDSQENAEKEIAFFFADYDLLDENP